MALVWFPNRKTGLIRYFFVSSYSYKVIASADYFLQLCLFDFSVHVDAKVHLHLNSLSKFSHINRNSTSLDF